MRTLFELEQAIDAVKVDDDPVVAAEELLSIGEEVLENWIVAKDGVPTDETREGFRLLALHRQGTKNDPSFNACRETCRELAYYFNLITLDPDATATTNRTAMMKMISNHLYLFISGKLQVAQLGDFCCSAKPIRMADQDNTQELEGV
ncbi:MAG: hypothetical protein QNJ05_14740 [Woeseiaceae bacterium]|nr:hypothetical protein [Woeseiaceae bacterium]